jgi:hypothetical protein
MINLRTWLANRIARPQLRKRNAEIRNLDETCMRLRAERDEAQARVKSALDVIHVWQRVGESNDYLTRVHRALNPPVSGNSASSN